MKFCTTLFYLLLLTSNFFFSQYSTAQIVINEVQVSNETTITDNFLEYDDWIEFYNTTNSYVNLAGYYLTDDILNLTKFKIENTNAAATTIPSNGYLLFWADNDVYQGENHCNFKLSSSGETVFIVMPDGVTIVDSLTYDPLTTDQTYKRIPNGSNNLITSTIASPLSSNNSDLGLLEPPTFSISSGVYAGNQTITLSTISGANIYYTTDGSDPNFQSTVYNGPITISQNKAIKAMATKGGYTNSEIKTNAYLINVNHDLPIITVNMDDEYLYSDTQGILVEGTNGTTNPHGICNDVVANYWQEWEHPGNAILLDETGKEAFNVDGGISVFGNCSRKYAQKNLALKTKSIFPSENISYKIFPTLDQDEFRRVRLRSAGDHWETSMMGDLIYHGLVENKIDIEVQSSTPTVSYINGEYNGIFNLRQAYSKHYLRYKFDKLAKSDFDIIRMEWKHTAVSVVDGDSIGINNLFDLFDPSVTFTNQIVDSIYNSIDINNFINYFISSMWVYADDWPSTTSPSNLIYWKPKETGAKWRVAILDSDEGWLESDHDTYTYLVEPGSANSRHGEKSTRFIRRLLSDVPAFNEEFVQRAFTYYNTLFNADTVANKINKHKALIENEMYGHTNLWGDEGGVPSYNDWLNEVDNLITYANERSDNLKDHIADFHNKSIIDISFNFNQNTNGTMLVNSNFFSVPDNYTGEYLKDIPLWIHAVPKPGYRFVRWLELSNSAEKYNPHLHKSFGSNQTLTPIFEPALNVVINEIHYNPITTTEQEEFIELYNPDSEAKPLYGYQLNNGVEFTFPENTFINADEYIIIAKDASLYTGNAYQVFEWTCGSLNNDGEKVFFSNAANTVIDSVAYNDNIDWDQNADGLGYSLALINHTQDNYQPSAWASQLADQVTPGSINNFCGSLTNNPMVAHVSCYQNNDGFIVPQISGGRAPFTYSWSNGVSTSTNTNLAPGAYTLTISDFYNCTSVETINITQPVLLSGTSNSTDETYYQANDGTATVNASGGTPPYTYNWSNGATTSTVSNLTEGTYSVSVVDANSCTKFLGPITISYDCTTSIVQQNQPALNTRIYKVAQYIQSNGIVNLTKQISFRAGNYVELVNDFEVIKGAEFEAIIDGCQ